MTVDTTTVAVTREGTGATYSFSFPFDINAASELEVTYIDSDDVETLLSEGTGSTNYSVTVSSFPGAGSITYPADGVSTQLPAGEFLHIRRKSGVTQDTTLNTQGGYNPRTQERLFDKLTRIIQEHAENLDRTAAVPETTSFTGLAGASPIVNDDEDGFRWAVGFEGPQGDAGADGATGANGPAGPWKYLATYDLATESSIDIEDFVGEGYIAVALRVVRAYPGTDGAIPYIRYKKNGTYQTEASYEYAVTFAEGDDTSDLVGVQGDDAVELVPSNGTGNTSVRAMNTYIEIFDPDTAGRTEIAWHGTHRNTVGNLQYFDGGGSYSGTDAAEALQGIRLLLSTGVWTGGTVYVYGLRVQNEQAFLPISHYHKGTVGSSEIVLRYVATEDFTIDVDYSGSILDANVAATAETIFDITVADVSQGTITVAAAGTTGTWNNSASNVSVSTGDVIEITGPSTADSTIADLAISIRATADAV